MGREDITSREDARFSVGTYRFGEAELKSLVLENEFSRVTIVPERGGRIVEWLDKKQNGDNLVDLPAEPEAPGYGGLLGDHGWVGNAIGFNLREFEYVYNITGTGPEMAAVELWPFEQKYYRREIILRRGHAGLEIKYTFANIFQEDASNTLVCNVIQPSGRPFPEDHLYITPLEHALVVDGNPVSRDAVPGAPWRAFASRSCRRTVACAFDNDLYKGPYDWNGSRTRPSFEWYFRGVPMGKSVETTVRLFALHGFDHLAHAGQRFAADLDARGTEGGIAISWALSSVEPELKDVLIRTRLTDPDGREIALLQDTQLTGLEVDMPRRGEFGWSTDARPLIIKQEVYSGGELLGDYEIPFGITEAGADYRRTIAFPAKAEYRDIPGWKLIPPLQLQIRDADRQRGCFVFSAEGPQAGTALQTMDIDLGVDEFETYEIRFMPLADVGSRVYLSVTGAEGLPAGAVSLTVGERRTVEIWGQERAGWKLLEAQEFAPVAEAEERIWVRCSARGLLPGDYTAALSIRLEKGEPCHIPLHIRVWPVQLPEDRHFFLEPNSQINQLGLPGGEGQLSNLGLAQEISEVRAWSWDIPALSVYADDLYDHGARMVKAYSYGTAPGQGYAVIRMRDSGEPLLEALRRDPDLLQSEPLPSLDMSFWDPWLQVWIDRRFTRYSTRLGWLATNSPEDYFRQHEALALEYGLDHQRLRRWLSSETARYLKEKGFRYVYGTIADEIAGDLFQEWMEAAADARACGWSPGVTISDHFFKNSALYREAGSLMDYWIIGDPQSESLAMARHDGYISAASSLGSYEGWGTFFRQYSHLRQSMWQRCLAGVDVFWIQCYIRRKNESMVFNENGRPYASAAWEGLRDGVEDANYLKGAIGMLERLKVAGRQAIHENYRQRFDAITGSVDKEDAWSMRQARTELFRFLLDIRRELPASLPSLAWQDLPLISEGRPLFSLSAIGEARSAAALFADMVRQKTGVEMPLQAGDADIAEAAIIFGHPSQNALLQRLIDDSPSPDVTEGYPDADSYIIKEFEYVGRRVIAVIGRGRGLELGVRNFFSFLTLNTDYTEQYFVNK